MAVSVDLTWTKRKHTFSFSASLIPVPLVVTFYLMGCNDTRKRIRFSCSITVNLVFCIRFILRNIQFLYSHPSSLTFPTSRSSLFLFLQLQPRPLFVFLSAFTSFISYLSVCFCFSFSLLEHMFINLSPFLRKPQELRFFVIFFFKKSSLRIFFSQFQLLVHWA